MFARTHNLFRASAPCALHTERERSGTKGGPIWHTSAAYLALSHHPLVGCSRLYRPGVTDYIERVCFTSSVATRGAHCCSVLAKLSLIDYQFISTSRFWAEGLKVYPASVTSGSTFTPAKGFMQMKVHLSLCMLSYCFCRFAKLSAIDSPDGCWMPQRLQH